MSELRTIGAYGWDQDRFLAALISSGVTDFCDVRARRGVRGARYAFANAKRLVGMLEAHGVRYHYWRDLAPEPAARATQHRADAATGTGKRHRVTLEPAFIERYRTQLAALDWLDEDRTAVILGGGACLFCVEATPDACHRSLLADEIARRTGVTVRHL